MDINIKHTSLHHIDHANNEINEIDITNQGEALAEYINRLVNEISSSNSKRSFVFQRGTTEVRSAIAGFLAGNYADGTISNAQRLLSVEQETQEQISHLNKEIQKGSLFQAVIVENGTTKVIISKADHSQYLDETDFLVHRGLPWKKRVFKAVLVIFDTNHEVENIFVFDTNSIMSKYWWHGYLELKEKHTDIHNTKTSLDVLDKKIFNPIKKKHPADHIVIRNSAVGYFRNKEEFELNDFIDSILTNYQPVDPNLSTEKLISKASELPDKWNFDPRFKIKKEEINKRIVNKVALTDSIELVFKDHVTNLRDAIVAVKDSEGNKYIKIRTDAGYDRFTDETS